jgi:hypothetical protein
MASKLKEAVTAVVCYVLLLEYGTRASHKLPLASCLLGWGTTLAVGWGATSWRE